VALIAEDQLDALRKAHRFVFDHFTYVPDPEKWKTPDYWLSVKEVLSQSITGKYEGDCDDFALIMRHECRQADIPNRLCFCWVPEASGYHLVMEAGGWIADNRYPHLMTRDLLYYEWVMHSGYERGDDWHYTKPFTPDTIWPHLR